jgi:hypothetical protein
MDLCKKNIFIQKNKFLSPKIFFSKKIKKFKILFRWNKIELMPQTMFETIIDVQEISYKVVILRYLHPTKIEMILTSESPYVSFESKKLITE